MGILSGKNIVKRYGKDTVLKNVNIDIETGKIYGLIGRNGAGNIGEGTTGSRRTGGSIRGGRFGSNRIRGGLTL